MEAKLLESLTKHFNFTYNVIHCYSDWGVHYPNDTWSGLMGKIVSEVIQKKLFYRILFLYLNNIQKEADLAFGGLTVTHERSQYVYFTDPHIITSVSFITHSPKSQPKVTLVIEPFEGLVVCKSEGGFGGGKRIRFIGNFC